MEFEGSAKLFPASVMSSPFDFYFDSTLSGSIYGASQCGFVSNSGFRFHLVFENEGRLIEHIL